MPIAATCCLNSSTRSRASASLIGEQVRLVIDLHLKHNISLRQLAKEWDLKEQQLKLALADHRAQQRGEDHGWKFKKLRIPAKTYVALNRINSDVTYGLAVQCAVGHKGSMSPSNVEDMVSDVVKTKSESDAATVIQKYRDEATRSEASKNARHARLPEARPTVCSTTPSGLPATWTRAWRSFIWPA